MFSTVQRLFRPNLIERQLFPGPSVQVVFRTYSKADFDSCVEIYDANAPDRFQNDRRGDFLAYLSGCPQGLIVAEHEGRVVGFAGLVSYEADVHILVYGIVAPEFQGRGIGSTLTPRRTRQNGTGNRAGSGPLATIDAGT